MLRKTTVALLGAAILTSALLLLQERVEAVVLQDSFVDTGNSIHINGIEAIAAASITVGCNPPANDRFCPDRAITRAEAATFLARALSLPATSKDYFVDDNGHILEGAINRIAEAGLTQGCNPPTNNRFCPDRTLTRAEMAAFLSRGLRLPATSKDYFVDDNGHVLEGAINRIAEAGITSGCNPPANDRFCPNRSVTRAETATFFTRAFNLPVPLLKLPLADDRLLSCGKDGRNCTVFIELNRHRRHLIQEGWFQVLPYRPGEEAQFTSSSTTFQATLNGQALSLTAHPLSTGSSQATRIWSTTQTFSSGSHVLVAEWRWNGTLVRRVTATISTS